MKDHALLARAKAESSFRDVQGKAAQADAAKPQYEVEGDALREKTARLKRLREAREAAQGKYSRADPPIPAHCAEGEVIWRERAM